MTAAQKLLAGDMSLQSTDTPRHKTEMFVVHLPSQFMHLQ